jgi:hypothetical protein
MRRSLLPAIAPVFFAASIGAASAAPPTATAASRAAPEQARVPGEDPGDIVVTGERTALGERIGAYVAALTAETANGQVARWDRRLCLNIEGVSDAQRAFLTSALSAEARPLGVDVEAGRRCDPSAFVIFSADPDELLARIGDSRPYFFGGIPLRMQRNLRTSRAPVRWLSFSQLRGAGGERPTNFSTDIGKGGVEHTVPAIRSVPSRTDTPARMDVQSMVVLVDARRLAGISNGSLGAYLSMVILGNIRPDHDVDAAVSVLGLFDEARRGDVVTAGLTEWDRAYLRSLYQGNWNLTAGQRMARIGAAMERELVRETAAAR